MWDEAAEAERRAAGYVAEPAELPAATSVEAAPSTETLLEVGE